MLGDGRSASTPAATVPSRRPSRSTGGSAPTTAGTFPPTSRRRVSGGPAPRRCSRPRCGCRAATSCSARTASATPTDRGASSSRSRTRRRRRCIDRAGRPDRRAGPGRLDGASSRRRHAVLTLPRPPRRWAAGAVVRATVVPGGGASEATTWNAPIELAVLVPGAAPHACCAPRSAREAASTSRASARRRRGRPRLGPQLERGDAGRAPGAVGERGRRGARRPAARAAVGAGRGRRARGLGLRRRSGRRLGAPRLAARGAPPAARAVATVDGVRALDARREPAGSSSRCGSARREIGTHVDLLPGFPPEWLGQSLAVHDAAAARRAALVRGALARRAARAAVGRARRDRAARPALDPAWSSTRAAGETLLAEPPAPLLADGTGRRDGDADRRARAVLVSDGGRRRRPRRSDRGRAVRPGRARTRPCGSTLLDVPHRRGRRVDPRARAGRRGGRAAQLRRVPQLCGPTATAGRSREVAERGRDRRRASRSACGGAPGFADPRPFERRFGEADVACSSSSRDLARVRRSRSTMSAARAHDRRGDRPDRRGRDRAAALEHRGAARSPTQQFVDVARTYATSWPTAVPAHRRRDRHASTGTSSKRSAAATARSDAPTSTRERRASSRSGSPTSRGYTGLCRTSSIPCELGDRCSTGSRRRPAT